MTFREDDSRIRERVAGPNITWLYRATLSILKPHPDRRMSLIMNRRGWGWSEKLLMESIDSRSHKCFIAMETGAGMSVLAEHPTVRSPTLVVHR